MPALAISSPLSLLRILHSVPIATSACSTFKAVLFCTAKMEFSYTPLDLDRPSFRLARLKAGHGEEPISCELINALFDDDIIDYEAVSYTWGTSSVHFGVVWLNGREFLVGYNLWSVLHDLRLSDQDRYIWVDAICIDQESHGERNHQVQQMRGIYGRAHRVVFWLGPLTTSIRLLMDWLAIVQNENPGGWPLKVDELRVSSPVDYTAMRDGLSEILSRPWFGRVWILQEVANARTALVHCGSRAIFAKVLPSCPKLFDIQPPPHCQAVLDVMPGSSRLTSWWSQGRDVLTLLRKFGGSGASRDHDRIYALRGLCDSDTEIPPTDYAAPMSKVISDTISTIYGLDVQYLGQMYTTFEEFASALDTIHYSVLAQLLRSAPSEIVIKFLSDKLKPNHIRPALLEAEILQQRAAILQKHARRLQREEGLLRTEDTPQFEDIQDHLENPLQVNPEISDAILSSLIDQGKPTNQDSRLVGNLLALSSEPEYKPMAQALLSSKIMKWKQPPPESRWSMLTPLLLMPIATLVSAIFRSA